MQKPEFDVNQIDEKALTDEINFSLSQQAFELGWFDSDGENISQVIDDEVLFDDIGGYESVVSELRFIAKALADSQYCDLYGVSLPKGILLYGPPGTGKTTLVRALAHESGVRCVQIMTSDIYGGLVGLSEKNMAKVFDDIDAHEGRTILFIDDFDTFMGSRKDHSADNTDEKVQNVFFQRIDGYKSSGKVLLIAATNFREHIDDAVLRSGRFDLKLKVDVPDEKARTKIFEIHRDRINKQAQLSRVFADFDWQPIVEATQGFVGADIKSFLEQVVRNKVRRIMFESEAIEQIGFDEIMSELDSFKRELASQAGKVGYIK